MDPLTDLENSTRALQDAHKDVHRAHTALNKAKRLLATRENLLTARGLEGKNEAARKAELAAQCISEQEAVNTAEDELRDAQLALTLAELTYRYDREAIALRRAELLSLTQAAD